MFPKATGYRTKRARAKSAYKADRPAARESAFDRDGGRCIFPDCRKMLALDACDPYRLANGHELLSRAQGGSPVDVDNIVITCGDCHMALHTPVGGKTARIDGTTLGARGPLRFYRKRQQQWIEVS